MDLKNMLAMICDWENKYNEQCALTNEIITHYNTLKLNENKLKAELKEMREFKECALDKLLCYKAKIEEKNELFRKLRTDLRSMEEENYNLRRQINVNGRLGTRDSKCTTTELTKQVETNSKLAEQDKLADKFDTLCEKLNETKIAFNDVKNTVRCDILNIENTVDALSRLSDAEKCKQKLSDQIDELKEKECRADEELNRRNKKIKELRRENEYYKIDNMQKKQLRQCNLKEENVSSSKRNCHERAKQKNNCAPGRNNI